MQRSSTKYTRRTRRARDFSRWQDRRRKRPDIGLSGLVLEYHSTPRSRKPYSIKMVGVPLGKVSWRANGRLGWCMCAKHRPRRLHGTPRRTDANVSITNTSRTLRSCSQSQDPHTQSNDNRGCCKPAFSGRSRAFVRIRGIRHGVRKASVDPARRIGWAPSAVWGGEARRVWGTGWSGGAATGLDGDSARALCRRR